MALAFARRWALLFGVLFAVTVPLGYRVLPSLGVALRPWLEASGQALLKRPVALFSDSADLYAYAAGLLLATALAAAAWAAGARRAAATEARLWYGLHTGVAWFLALQLLEYGFDKVFKHQFYLPEPNTLYTPLGQLPPDLAYWSVMGASRSYSVFAGLLEVLPGLLLLWGRTRLVGGIMAVAVLANVLALNIGFDISVKLWSGSLLLLAVLVAAPGLRTAYYALVRACYRPARPMRPAGWQGRWVGALRGVGLGILLLETAGPFGAEGTFNDDQSPRPPLHGAYAVAALRPAAAVPLRLFVHRQGYLLTQAADGQLQAYKLTYAPGRLLLRDETGRSGQLSYTVSSAGLRLVGTLGADSVLWLARPLPWRQLPLLRGW
ncbi:MAG TPA: hypothetical protein VFO93_10210 [Hymenobacter sp.]|uniref:hypothetical protein n=1 Tax=Hymenobacter sp. TaxID=1898978 RepID=UPI002D7EB755|nr:hypothetical protein [Hymenobacter sp.]HET9503906.1 hypothetical protein [Hymenobacter sp.]